MYGAPVRLTLLALLFAGSAWAARIDPGAAGPDPVGVSTLVLVDASRARTLVTEIWYPAPVAQRDVVPRGGRFPLVLMAHGFCGFRTNYEYLTVRLASWGFIVAAPDFPGLNQTDCANGVPAGNPAVDQPADLSFLRSVFHDRTGPAVGFVRHVRGQHTGLAGHSLGGLAVLHAAVADPHFTVVAALAAFTDGLQASDFATLRPRRAMMSLGGTADMLLPFDMWAARLFTFFQPPAFLVKIVGGTHSGFSDMDAQLAPDALVRQQTLTQRYVTALFRRELAGDRRFAAVLTPADAEAQGADVVLTARLH